MKMKNMGVKCNECGKYFIAGSRPDGMPNGIGFMMEDGSVHNVCADCLTKMGNPRMKPEPIPRASMLERIIALNKAYDKKLQELMTEEEYNAFARETVKQMFLAEIMASPDEEFKKFVTENFEEIIEDGEAMYKAMKDAKKGEGDDTEENH